MAFTGIAAIGLFGYMKYIESDLEKKRAAAKDQAYGRPKIGGSFSLVDHFGVPRTNKDYLGKYVLLYYTFSNPNL